MRITRNYTSELRLSDFTVLIYNRRPIHSTNLTVNRIFVECTFKSVFEHHKTIKHILEVSNTNTPYILIQFEDEKGLLYERFDYNLSSDFDKIARYGNWNNIDDENPNMNIEVINIKHK